MATSDETKPSVDEINHKVYIVDPNPPEMGMHSPEDMFIYVSFTAQQRDRSTYVGKVDGKDKFIQTANEGEINFIATQVKYDDKGDIIKK